ncbi:DUF427 domain-containing protein [Streptomyces mirabilis]|uniref:DUF427 domain-containing protein n=1 Tax=Streptomyces mirabilis TaxID=68239 RepID=A0ABU3V6R6_9ACTN|nr:DUF427 domain-containing protein [Streptomyces mirabilis]MCX4617813.1 DUF427 domain-containing protein [Streptomyces mirabilis]MCX5356760.1 DUF427 domain-containing protein [Streptomyces mirabilis]MDU9001872.1 DUF427 domain-containing protein [Streptomyces mirabilis]
MKAVVGETVVAEAVSEAVVSIEGNIYFRPDSVAAGALRDSPTPYTCPWKGRAQYHDVVVGKMALRDGAWSYPNIKESAATRVGRDFSGYVAFDVRQVRIEN